jgi:hypothetical protein
MESDIGSDEELDENIRKDLFGEEEYEDVSKGVDPEKHTPNTPPVNTRMLLDDLDKTPRSPAVKIVHQKEVDAIKGKNRNEDELFQVPRKTKPEEFVEQINKSKEYTNAIVVQGEDRMTSPIDFKGDVVIEDQKDDFVHSIWGEIYKIYGSCNPSMARNPEVWAEPVHRFLDTFLGGDWANVKVKGQTATNLIKHKLPRALFKGDGRISKVEAINMKKTEKGKKAVDNRMDIDPKEGVESKGEYKPPAGTRAEKMKKAETKPVSPIKVSKIPKPLPVPVVEPKKKKTTVQDVQEKSSRAEILNKEILARRPVPVPKKKGISYAQVVAVNKYRNNYGERGISMEIWNMMKEIAGAYPNKSMEEIERMVDFGEKKGQTPSKGRNTNSLKAQVAMGVSKGPSRKAAIFGLNNDLYPGLFKDMGKVVDGMNKHLTFSHSRIRIQSGQLCQKVVQFYLNIVPTTPEFGRIKECLFKTLNLDLEGNDAFAPQSKAHLILKGFDYYTTRYSKRPEDILTGEQVVEMMTSVQQFAGIECVRNPAVIRSKGSNDMAVVFMDIWDSQNGINSRNLVNKVYHIGGKLIRVEYARPREFVLQCQKCWKWNHGTKACRLNHVKCARCGAGHRVENHNQHSTCCSKI